MSTIAFSEQASAPKAKQICVALRVKAEVGLISYLKSAP